MRTSIYRALIVTAALGLGPVAAQAQLSESMNFTTAFPFTVGAKSFPAGKYTIQRPEGQPGVIQIVNNNRNGKDAAYVEVESFLPMPEPKKSEVVFKGEGDHYALQTVWDAGDGWGVQVPPTAAERQIQKATSGERHIPLLHIPIGHKDS
jgi:hypothetical protein